MGVAIPNVAGIKILNHTYGYVNQNSIRYVDPTGEYWNLIPGAVIGGGLYCYIKGLEACAEKYPNHKMPDHPDRPLYMQCTTGVANIIALGMGMGSDPIGTATGAAAEEIMCARENQCQ